MKTAKQFLSIAMSLTLSLGIATQASAASTNFTDVPSTHWAYSYVQTASENGWIAGVGDNLFGVNNQVTFAQLSTMLIRAFFNDAYEAYTGQNDNWFSAFTGVADSEGLFNGTSAEGKAQDGAVVNQPVNRYDMAQMMYNILVLKDAVPEYDAVAVQAGIADWSTIPTGYQAAVMGANVAGIISGVDNVGTFNGTGLMTRGQAAVVMTNINKVVSNTQGPVLYTVTRVIDGDTIEVDYNGTLEKVRLIGVDTPESVHPDSSKNTEEGILASDYTKERLEGKQVELEFDIQQRDQYGRLLAYVWVDGVMYNKTLLEDGVANLATYPPNVKYVDEFTAIVEARNTQEETPIKTNGTYVGSIDSDKYHIPGCRFAENILPENEVWFDTAEEAQSAGYEPCGVCQ